MEHFLIVYSQFGQYFVEIDYKRLNLMRLALLNQSVDNALQPSHISKMYLILYILVNMARMRNTMPARPKHLSQATIDQLIALGQAIRTKRKALKISATTLAQAAGMSRITVHRIEAGEPAVTMGAYCNAMMALGMHIGITPKQTLETTAAHRSDNPLSQSAAYIRLTDYPQLKQLAWHVHGTNTLTPTEALGIYERNWRHLDESLLTQHEKELIESLRLELGSRRTSI